jgi:hypothetical protein
MLLRVKITLLVPKEDVVGKNQCRFKEVMIMKLVPPLVVYNDAQYHHKIKFKRLDPMRIFRLTEMTTMMMDNSNHTRFAKRGMEVNRAICPYYMFIISIRQFGYGKPETVKTRYKITTNLI